MITERKDMRGEQPFFWTGYLLSTAFIIIIMHVLADVGLTIVVGTHGAATNEALTYTAILGIFIMAFCGYAARANLMNIYSTILSRKHSMIVLGKEYYTISIFMVLYGFSLMNKLKFKRELGEMFVTRSIFFSSMALFGGAIAAEIGFRKRVIKMLENRFPKGRNKRRTEESCDE